MSSHIDPEDLKYNAQANDPPAQDEYGDQHNDQHNGQHNGQHGGGRPGGEHGGRYGDGYGRPHPYPYPYYAPPAPPFACPAGTGAYTVQPGDSLYAIATRYGVAPESVIAANPGVDFNYLQVGQIICL